MILYHKESTLLIVNEARRHLFCKKNKSLENLPPTQDALLQHTRRTIYQVAFGIQVSIQSKMFLHLKAGAGQKDKNIWKPVWITIPEVARACSELIRCMGANRRMQCPLQVHKIRSFLYRLVQLYMCILATSSY